MASRSLLRLLVTVGGTFLVAVGGSLITLPRLDNWYSTLNLPPWTPPAEWFGPIWTTLYLFMAVAAFLVWQKGCHRRMVQAGLTMYVSQLGLNFLWSFLFFGVQEIAGAALEIIALFFFVLGTQIIFWRSSKTASILFTPYTLWLGFASILNFSIWQLNR